MTTTQRVPVLIVGGGGAGLTASMLFATHGVESLLVSALPSTSIMPKAHVLNPRLAFVRMREFSRAGAILVRPDRVIAWRSMGAVADPARELGAVLDRVLGNEP